MSCPSTEVGKEAGNTYAVIDELRSQIRQRIEQRRIRHQVNWRTAVRVAFAAAGCIVILTLSLSSY